MEAAAKEFAAHGFDGASLNRILEQAEISKGAAYYYFDDKADVFLTVVQYYRQEVMHNIDLDINQLTAETFWPTLSETYQRQLVYVFERPWVMGVFKAINKVSAESLMAHELLAAFLDEVKSWLATFFKRGQVLGVIRHDLPDDLIVQLFWAIDEAHDQWLLAHKEELKRADIEKVIIPRLIDVLQRVFTPAE
jgi:AcrR family transcriptional regulator